MRYKAEHKEETHKRIVETASREFREKGFEGVGIAALMKKLDLTHGGFYAHFENKDELVQESISQAFDEADNYMEESIAEAGIAGVIELYLSLGHVEQASLGCPVPALASEMSRQHPDSSNLFSERLRHRISLLADELPGETASERLDLANFIFSSMVGAVATARATAEPDRRQSILESTRKRLLKLVKP